MSDQPVRRSPATQQALEQRLAALEQRLAALERALERLAPVSVQQALLDEIARARHNLEDTHATA